MGLRGHGIAVFGVMGPQQLWGCSVTGLLGGYRAAVLRGSGVTAVMGPRC